MKKKKPYPTFFSNFDVKPLLESDKPKTKEDIPMPAKGDKSKTLKEIGEKGVKELDKMIEELKDADEILNKTGISRLTLQSHIGKKQQDDKKFYEVPNLYKAKSSTYKPKAITWSDKRGINIGAKRISEDVRKAFEDGKTTFELSVKGGKITLTPKD